MSSSMSPSSITCQRLEDDLGAIGLSRGDIVCVHSSMKKIGSDVEGGPQTVIQALLNVLGPEGTLLMPVFNMPEKNVHLSEAKSRLGLITEVFRTWPGVIRSNDPTHSVGGIGAQAAEILAGHEDCAPLGVNSPLHKAAVMGSKTLHLGTNVKSCSLLHIAEPLAGAAYLSIGYPGFHDDFNYTGTDGVAYFKKKTEAPGDSAGFMKIMKSEAVQATYTTGLIGEAESLLFDSESLLKAVVNLLKNDIHLLLCENENCTVCVQRKAVTA